MGGPVDPVEGVWPKPQPDERGERPSGEPVYRRVLRGEITAVHRRSGHAAEGHVLDVTVGEQSHNEIVVRVLSGDLDELVGRHVTVTIE